MPSEAAGATAAVADLVVAEAVAFAEVAVVVHFVGAVEAVRFAVAEASAVFEAAADLGGAFAGDLEASAAGLGGLVVLGAASVAALALGLATAGRDIGPVTPTDILTPMDIPTITDIPVITDTIRTLTVDLAQPDHMRLIRPRPL